MFVTSQDYPKSMETTLGIASMLFPWEIFGSPLYPNSFFKFGVFFLSNSLKVLNL